MTGQPDSTVRKPLAGDVPLVEIIDPLTREGELFVRLDNGMVRCTACAHLCRIRPGGRGVCQVRYNLDGQLKVPFGYVVALQTDPTEKKPFYHVYPGSDTLSFGMLGCDMHCDFCQNWDISQTLRDARAGRPVTEIRAEEIVQLALSDRVTCIASTYNEPLIASEWAHAIFTLAKQAGLTTLYVSNGNASREVLEYMRPVLDGYKVDLKTMSERHYRKLGAQLHHVLDGIRMAHEMGYWVEVVTLIVPGMNDTEAELREAARFIRSVSPDIPWHVTAFHPNYRRLDPPPTSVATVMRAAEIGYEEGLHYVYAGNAPGRVGRFENTYCPQCSALLIGRVGYVVTAYHLTAEGTCPQCGTKIAGKWTANPQSVRLGSAADLWFRAPRRPR